MQSHVDRKRVSPAARRLVGVAGVAFTVTAAAAAPALADPGQPDKQPKPHPSPQATHTAAPASSHGSTARPASSHSPSSKPKGKGTSKPTGRSHDPAGNNGTFFVRQSLDGISHPGNQPHVSCTFYLSFFGFDSGQALSVSFTGQAPTGKGQAIPTTATTTLTSTTPAGGAGNDYDGYLGAFDGSNLDLSGLGAPAKQGYHIKVDVATKQGGGHKYKVFWFSPCTPAPTATSGGTTTTGGTTSSGTVSTPGTEGTAAAGESAGAISGNVGGGGTVEGLTATRGTTAGTPTQVLGERFSRTPRTTPHTNIGIASLPFTGGETALLAALGAATLGGGAALTMAGRRRRLARHSA